MLFGIGLVVALIPNGDRDDIRKAMTIIGCVSGLAASCWLVPAITTFIAEQNEHAALDGWVLMFVLGLGYGGVTRWLTPMGRDEQRQDAM